MSNWRVVVNGSAVDPETSTSYSFIIEQWPGAGMPGLQNISTDFGLLDGAIFQRQRVPSTSFTLTGTINGSSVADLHTKRRNLIDAVKPDRSASQQPVVLQYLGSGSTRQASAFFEAGLELGDVDVYREKLALRFVQFDPYWESVTSSSAALTTQASFTANYIVQRSASGAWHNMNGGTNGRVTAILPASGNDLIIGGCFTTVNGTATTASRVGQYNATTGSFGTLGNGMSSVVNVLLRTGDNYLIAGGLFTTASNLTVNNVARWTGTGWTTAGSGITGGSGVTNAIYDGVIDSAGNAILVGAFDKIDSTNASCIARWNISSSNYSAIASGLRSTTAGTGTIAYEIDIAKNDDLWVGGAFLAAGLTTNTACYVAYYSQSSSAWGTVAGSGIQGSAGLNTAVNAVGIAKNGNIYFATDLTGAACNLYVSDGVSKTAISGFNNSIYTIIPDPYSEFTYVTGAFTAYNNVALQGVARISGGNVRPADVKLPGTPTIYGFYSASTGELTMGFTTSGTACAPTVTTVTNNGTAVAYPVLTACAPSNGSAMLVQLTNYTTNDTILFNNMVIASNEIITVDLRPGKKTITSNVRGNVVSYLMPGSNLATWKLTPGANNVSFWMTGGGGAAKLTWYDRFWSAD